MFLGIDCGSVSVKAVLLNGKREVVASHYLRNQGIVSTLGRCLNEVLRDCERPSAVGITGSGRRLAALAVGADAVETEILCHATAAIRQFPDVRTIFDVGGEDSKLIKVRNGVACDFRMNHVCGAGTGALIDSVAARLGIAVCYVGEKALKHNGELPLPGKCGVFTQSALVSRLNKGAEVNDVLWSVVKALARNYLLLAKGIELKPPFVFQGAVALNKAVVKALEEEIGHPVIVPEHCAFMGAIGAALVAVRNLDERKQFPQCVVPCDRMEFRGPDALRGVKTRIVRGDGCPNRCEITQLLRDGAVVASSGNRCDRCGETVT